MKLTIENVQKIKESNEIKLLIQDMVKTIKNVEVVKAEVVPVYNELLKEFNFKDERQGQPIVDYTLLYLTDQDTTEFYERAKNRLEFSRRKCGVDNRDLCPLLVEEDKLVQIKINLIKKLDEILEASGLLINAPIKNQNEMILITTKYVGV